MSFSQAIMNVMIPTNFMTPKITFTGTEDPEAHLTVFHTQMMISGGTNPMHCKLFMGMFAGTTLDWFIGLPDGYPRDLDLCHQPILQKHLLSSGFLSDPFLLLFILLVGLLESPRDLHELLKGEGITSFRSLRALPSVSHHVGKLKYECA